MIVDIILVCAAAALFGRGLYHSGALTGWIAKGLAESQADRDNCWDCQQAGQCVHNNRCRPAPPPPAFDFDAHEAKLFLATGAWWLDPNRWGDNPGWRDNLPREIARAEPRDPRLAAVRNMPRCPICHTGSQVAVLAQHGREASMWDCAKCGCEFTVNGETEKSRVARLSRPPVHNPTLPCGCPWEGPIYHHGKGETHYVRCGTCYNAWEPASNSPSGRIMGQGEKLIPKNDAGRLPRPRCPSCGRSHPTLNVPIDYSRAFYKCGGCRHEWPTSRDVDVACRHAH